MTAKEKARNYFLEGYNCSQSVFCTFCDRFGIDEETAKKIAAGLGGGVGRMREVCGAVSASAMVLGSVCAPVDGSDNEGKMKNYELVREFADRFLERQPSVVCRELLEMQVKMEKTAKPDERTAEYYKKRPCLRVVEDAAEILEEMLK